MSDADEIASIDAMYDEFEAYIDTGDFVRNPLGFMNWYHDDTHMYDIVEPEELRGPAFAEHLKKTVPDYDFPSNSVRFNEREIYVAGGMAVATYIQTVHAALKGADMARMRIRCTDRLEKRDGRWRIMHQHASVALSPEAMGAYMAHHMVAKKDA